MAQVLNISKAAAILNIKQPVLSRHLQELELELGTPLLVRSLTKAGLTPAGERLAILAQETVSLSERISFDMRNMQGGSAVPLNIGFLPGLMTPPLPVLLEDLVGAFPELRFGLSEWKPAKQIAAVGERKLDIGFVGPVFGSLPSSLEVVEIAVVKLCLVMAVAQAQARGEGAELKNLADLRWIGLDEDMFPGWNAEIGRICADAGLKIPFCEMAGGLTAQMQLIALTKGVALLPATARDLPHEGVTFLPLDMPDAVLRLCVVVPRGNRRPEVDYILDRLKMLTPQSSYE